MSKYCCECGELLDNYPIGPYAAGCHCVVLAFRKMKDEAENDAADRVLTLLEAIGSKGECKKCGNEVFFVLHHSDRGENPKAGFAVKHKWRKWMRFDFDGKRHKCAE